MAKKEKGKTGHPVGAPMMKRPAFARARASLITEYKIKGIPDKDIGLAFNLSPDRVKQILSAAQEDGTVEETRQRMSQEMLPLAANVYKDILSGDVNQIDAIAKGYEIKLKAARQVAEGLGALGRRTTEIKQQQTLDLEGYHAIRRQRLGSQNHDRQRPLHGGDSAPVEGELFDHEGRVDGQLPQRAATLVEREERGVGDPGGAGRVDGVVGEAADRAADDEGSAD